MIKPGSKGQAFYRFARETTLRVVDDSSVNLQMFKNFLRITSEPQACSSLSQMEVRCSQNSQYDVSFRILSMWLKNEGKRYYDIIQELFFDRKDQILDFIRTTFSCIKLSP